MKPSMTRLIALLTLLVFVPQAALAQTSERIPASAYSQPSAPQPLPANASASDLDRAIEQRIAHAETAAANEDWREASRAVREAQRLDGSAPRVRLAQLGVRYRVAPSLVLHLDVEAQETLLHHADSASGLTIAGHVFGVLGAVSAVAGAVVLILGALGAALTAFAGAVTGTDRRANLDGLAPIIGLTGGLALAFAAVGGGFHLAASGENHAIRVALVPQASPEGGGLMVAGSF